MVELSWRLRVPSIVLGTLLAFLLILAAFTGLMAAWAGLVIAFVLAFPAGKALPAARTTLIAA